MCLPPTAFFGRTVHLFAYLRFQRRCSREKLASYMLRAPLSLAKMTYDAPSGTVIYRSKMHLAAL